MKKLILLQLLLTPFFVSASNNTIPATIITAENGEITSIQGEFNVSGIYPHLTTYTHARVNEVQSYAGSERWQGQRECGIGALAVWNDKLYMINYAAHEPKGSEHKLYIVDKNLKMEIFQGSVGGTPACRMVHQESEQLFIGHYAIAKDGTIRVISISEMPGRLTAIARHLKDPANKIYYYDMEGMLYEVDVHTLKPTLLYKNPLPGWHGKGAYTAQGKLILSNNGENYGSFEPTEHWQVDTNGVVGAEKYGVLAEYDGNKFTVVERKQFVDVTTKHGINAVPNDTSPIWAMGWDKRSVQLKVLDNNIWHTYLLPKATYNNDPSHGWFTEWPRIREINDGRYLMDMHGMFFDFPKDFSANKTFGIKPIGSHLRYIPDFTFWNGKIVLATDETSIQGNPFAGQAQSNLWFGNFDELSQWGPASGYGSIWIKDEVQASTPSLPYLFNGFDHKIIHLINHSNIETTIDIQLDTDGSQQWQSYKKITLPAYGYQYLIFDENTNAQWVRLASINKATLTATFHYTDANLRNSDEGKSIFNDIATADYTGNVSYAKLYSNKNNFNLTVFAGDIKDDAFVSKETFELNKYKFTFSKGMNDTNAQKALDNPIVWKEDEASIIIETKNNRLRLPKGKGTFQPNAIRNVREVESERELANISGTFYELPLHKVGEEALYKMMRPVATHNRQISDYNTWNGLLVMSGVKMDAKPSQHIVRNNNTALWIGGIDDIWKFGKPVGEGGVWKNSSVKANEYSDLYLMTGYDQKTVELLSDKDVQITVYVNVTHYTDDFVPYQTFQLKAGKKITHQFPKGFSAHWVRFKTDKECIATAWLKYE